LAKLWRFSCWDYDTISRVWHIFWQQSLLQRQPQIFFFFYSKKHTTCETLPNQIFVSILQERFILLSTEKMCFFISKFFMYILGMENRVECWCGVVGTEDYNKINMEQVKIVPKTVEVEYGLWWFTKPPTKVNCIAVFFSFNDRKFAKNRSSELQRSTECKVLEI
jgi:hypothetical protein